MSAEIENRFNHHPPRTQARIDEHETARAAAKETALIFEELLPPGREKALAATKLEEALFWANAAIARQP